jgi:hypothetical protein
MGEKRNVCGLLVGKPKGKRPLKRPRCRWVNNIKIDLRQIECDDLDWIDLAEDRNKWRAFVTVVMNFRLPSVAGTLSSGYTAGGLSSSA